MAGQRRPQRRQPAALPSCRLRGDRPADRQRGGRAPADGTTGAGVRSRVAGVLLGLAAALVAAWLPFWWWAPVGSATAFALLPLTPVVAVAALLVAVAALVLRRWAAGGVALVAAVALAVVVVAA